jgi:hypothetical protein
LKAFKLSSQDFLSGRDFAFEAALKQHLRKTSHPESFPGLVCTRPLKNVGFDKIFEFDLKPELRPDREGAHCPICSPDHPKFLRGALAWFPSEQCYRFIGRDCAAHFIGVAQAAQADRDYRARVKHNANYDFAFDNLGVVPEMVSYLWALVPVASHIESLVHALGRARVRTQLRKVVRSYPGQLCVWDNVQVEREDPFTGVVREVIETIPVEFGILDGCTALDPNFRPVRDIRVLINQLSGFDHGKGEDAQKWVVEFAYEFRGDLDVLRRVLLGADSFRERVTAKMQDVLRFFTETNFRRLTNYGADRRNPQPLYAATKNGEYRIGDTMAHCVRVRPIFDIFMGLPSWPTLKR